MRRFLLPTATAALVAVLGTTPAAYSASTWLQPGLIPGQDSNWANDNNWDTGFTPGSFDDFAVVGSTTLATDPNAVVNVTSAVTSPSVQIANEATTTGLVTIAANGSLLTAANNLTEGDFRIGDNGGRGTVNVQGVLNVARELTTPTAATLDSSLNLSGSASVTAEYGFLDRQLRIVGPNVSFTTTDNNGDGNSLILGGGGVHTWEFGAAGPSQLSVNGNLDLGGTLAIETPGFTPAAGTTWALADSVEVDANDASPSGFDSIDSSGVPGLGPGSTFRVTSGAAGTIGVLTELTLIQEPVITVNRQTGEIKLKNFSSDAGTVDFDAYTIRSANGSLGGTLDGLADQGTSGSTWFEANPTATGLGELNGTDSLSLLANQEISIGNVFQPPTPSAFGENNEDLSFDYGTPDGGLFNAEVVYEGTPNDTLVLNIDPDTGIASVVNPTTFDVDLDAYVISSNSAGLDTVGWSSLDEQSADSGNWFETPSDASQLSELLITGSVEMLANQGSNFAIGTPWDGAGDRDLVFQFALEGETFLRTGKVVYETLSTTNPPLMGDANGDGNVDLLDLDILGSNFGTTLGGTVATGDFNGDGAVDLLDLDILGSNFGMSINSSTAIPEPVGLAMVASVLLVSALRRRV